MVQMHLSIKALLKLEKLLISVPELVLIILLDKRRSQLEFRESRRKTSVKARKYF